MRHESGENCHAVTTIIG
ncbi:Protein of unknown function [Pyronema omphalodes CBS 100304]|uniref:Uncharacterized protein n=1 Tax=Pyronema omphalodes (strain CBS 100304) TaxID=1076935 RepID=U4KUA9_PYROM|nr:Protein of unknown function [Pyronema omphalodes CBS 100304]